MDGDGRADVVAEHSGWNEVGVYRQRADGTLASEDLYSAPYGGWNPNGLAVGDFTGNGTPDVAVADVNRGLVVLRNTSTPAPPAVPGAPELTSATGGDHSVTLLWKAPSQNDKDSPARDPCRGADRDPSNPTHDGSVGRGRMRPTGPASDT